MDLTQLKFPSGIYTKWNLSFGRCLMERTAWKIPNGTYAIERTSWNLHYGSHLVEFTPLKLPHGTYTMKVTSWNLHH